MPSRRRMLLGASGLVTVDPLDVFSPDTYTGNGTSQSIVNDIDLDSNDGLVWIKLRSAVGSHILTDTVRGATKYLISETTSAEATNAQTLTAFNADGFSVGNVAAVNSAAEDIVAWTFRKAAGFFDIVTYTGDGIAGRTVTHDLSVVPEMMIVKRLNATAHWGVYHKATTATDAILLNESNAAAPSVTYWNDTEPTNALFSVGTGASVNINTSTYIAYLFATLVGVSDVGSYTGNGTNQTIDCGFAAGVRFVMIKRTDTAGDWFMWDSERGIVAGNDPHLSANESAVEVTTDDSVDTDSSGFIVNQDAATDINVNTATYIYLAIA